MCLKPALAATIVVLLGSPVWAAKPAPPTDQSTQSAKTPHLPTSEEKAEAERMDPLARATFWSRVADDFPRDSSAGVNLARALRELARYDEATAASERVLVIAPSDLDALLENARDRIAAGQGFFAIDPAQRAAAAAPQDWRPESLLAIALEQARRDDEALAAHQRALALAPDNPAALSNLAMYRASHGQPAEAEALLRKAVAEPGATARERLNLALILGMEGRIEEAERLERQDLPPSTVDNNIAYFRAAANTPAPRSWSSVQHSP
jgi:Flp pilus assembly protein TadD